MQIPSWYWHPRTQLVLDWLLTGGSAVLCCILLLVRLPSMSLAGIGPNWPLIWVVAWSVKRSIWQGALAGLVLGLIQDGLSSPNPTHVLSLVVVGVLTACLQKQKYIQEDFISIALIVFGMAVVAETVVALQFCLHHLLPTQPDWSREGLLTPLSTPQPSANQELEHSHHTLGEIWTHHQRVALSSAILSSLWAPVVYYPLNRLWERDLPAAKSDV
ncbi:rod shape-determining protein MreD [Trichothermofontia sp.]